MSNLTNYCLEESNFIKKSMNQQLNYENLLSDNMIAVGVYNFPSLKLIKHNKFYEDILKKTNLKGRKSRDIQLPQLKKEENSENVVVTRFLKLISTQEKQVCDNIYTDEINGECRFFKCIMTPIIENNIMQYIIVSFINNTQIIKLKKENQLLKAKLKELDNKNYSCKNVLDRHFTEDKVNHGLSNNNEAILCYYLIKKQRELEYMLKNQEEFFSFIAHEFKTPLTVISSCIQLINSIYSSELPNNVKKYINKINISTLQQLRLVNNILDISRANAGYLNVNFSNYDIVNMTRVISESVKSFALRKNINLEFICNAKEKVIAIDDEKYERILLNLLSNAIKFTPQNKSVKVIINDMNNYINICVKDEGAGVPKDKQEIIFNKFRQVNNDLTRKSEGTGIGLCLVKLLVEAMNGKIKIESEVGKGSAFIITLPNRKVANENNDLSNNRMDNRLVQTLNIEFSDIYFE